MDTSWAAGHLWYLLRHIFQGHLKDEVLPRQLPSPNIVEVTTHHDDSQPVSLREMSPPFHTPPEYVNLTMAEEQPSNSVLCSGGDFPLPPPPQGASQIARVMGAAAYSSCELMEETPPDLLRSPGHRSVLSLSPLLVHRPWYMWPSEERTAACMWLCLDLLL